MAFPFMAIPAALSTFAALKNLFGGGGGNSGGYDYSGTGDETDIYPGTSSGGGIGSIFGKIGGYAKKNPIASLMALSAIGGIGGSRQDRKLKELQMQLLQEEIDKQQNLRTQLRPMSTEVLRRLIAAGPYGKTPNFSDLYNYGAGR